MRVRSVNVLLQETADIAFGFHVEVNMNEDSREGSGIIQNAVTNLVFCAHVGYVILTCSLTGGRRSSRPGKRVHLSLASRHVDKVISFPLTMMCLVPQRSKKFLSPLSPIIIYRLYLIAAISFCFTYAGLGNFL